MTIEKIDNRQLLFIIFVLRSVIAIATLPVLTTGEALQDAWLAAVITFWGTSLLALIVVTLGIRFPKKTLVEYSQDLLGPFLGKLISLIPLWVFLHLAATDIRIYGELIKTAFLPATPLIVIIGIMVLLSATAIYLGIEVVGRMADFLLPWFIFFLLISIIIVLPEIHLNNFQPVLAFGMKRVLSSSMVPIGFGAQILIMGFLIPNLTVPEKAVKTTLLAILGASLIILLVTFIVIGKLGAFEGSFIIFPFLSTIRGLERSEFVERLEIFGILAWGFGLFLSVSTYLYCGSKGLSQIMKMKNHRPLIFPMAVIWSTLALHAYESIFQIRTFFSPEVFFPYSVLTILLPFSLLWGGYLFMKIRRSMT